MMYARVYDKARKKYYKSIIYCGINQGYFRQYIVVNPYTNNFELVDYLDKTDSELRPLVEMIQNNCEDWVSYKNSLLLKHKAYWKQHQKEMEITFLWGYRDVCENFDFLFRLIESKVVQVDETDVTLRNLADADKWNYIQNQDDANSFMKLFAGFHDSTLDKLCYEENYDTTSVTATFDNRGWYGIVELCFEGISAINIRPAKENYSREIFEATLLVKEEVILWADWFMEKEDLSFDGSYIKALSLKWRKID